MVDIMPWFKLVLIWVTFHLQILRVASFIFPASSMAVSASTELTLYYISINFPMWILVLIPSWSARWSSPRAVYLSVFSVSSFLLWSSPLCSLTRRHFLLPPTRIITIMEALGDAICVRSRRFIDKLEFSVASRPYNSSQGLSRPLHLSPALLLAQGLCRPSSSSPV